MSRIIISNVQGRTTMKISLRRLTNIMLFVLLAPLIGYEETAREIASGGEREDRIFLRCTITRCKEKSLERELVDAARSYELSGLEHGTYFEYLLLKLSMFIEDLKRRVSEYHVAILTMTIGLTLLSLVLIVLIGSTISLLMTCVSCVLVLYLVHVFQMRILQYRYKRPLVVGLASAFTSIMIIITLFHVDNVSSILEISIITFSVPFLTLYLPQFANFIKLISNLRTRVMRPFYELLWNPVPTPMRNTTDIERELGRIFNKGCEIGAPWFIARINKVVEMLLDLILTTYRQGMMYAAFVPAGFLTVLFVVKFLYLSMLTSASALTLLSAPILSIPSPDKMRTFLLAYSYLTGLVTGKMMHSIGVGVLVGLILLIVTVLIL